VSNQGENLDRVSSRIGTALVEFCRAHRGETFHADDMRRHVTRTVGAVAPASADRILRDLRQRGVVDYVVVSRSGSLYLVNSVRGR
jgi:hypothetical protein